MSEKRRIHEAGVVLYSAPLEHALGRFEAIVRRELSAVDVRVLAASAEIPDADNVIAVALSDGGHVIVTFEGAPPDRAALARRLEMLARTFLDTAQHAEVASIRPPVSSSLHEELKALALRVGAMNCVVIDCDSPVTWGSAKEDRPSIPPPVEDALRLISDSQLPKLDDASGPLQDTRGPVDASGPLPLVDSDPRMNESLHAAETRRAIAHVRALPEIAQIRRGKHLHHTERDEHFGYLAISFSSIYLLVLVFDGEFDQLRAERATHEALPRVERLVLALPPLNPDPEPIGDVVAMRRPRKK